MSQTSRDDFPKPIKRTVGERSAYICANPDCRAPTIGPHSDPNKSLKTGEACHIRAAAPGGPRYDSEQTPEERSGIGNAIWLCAECSTRVDKDEHAYPATLLVQWRNDHEDWLRNGGMIPSIPSITLATVTGLTIPDVPGKITAEDIKELREHHLKVENVARMEIVNITARVQIPEPVILGGVVDKPAGIQVEFPPIRMPMTGHIKGGGTITRTGPPKPTNVHELKIDRIPASSSVEIAFVTSKKPFEQHDISFDQGPFAGTDQPPYIRDFINGTFQFDYRGATTQRRFFAPLDVDKENRKVSVREVREDFGPWKPLALSMFS